jgi:hypothetical protein
MAFFFENYCAGVVCYGPEYIQKTLEKLHEKKVWLALIGVNTDMKER